MLLSTARSVLVGRISQNSDLFYKIFGHKILIFSFAESQYLKRRFELKERKKIRDASLKDPKLYKTIPNLRDNSCYYL